jgi:tetratricopeptide (TPR) repeat protein
MDLSEFNNRNKLPDYRQKVADAENAYALGNYHESMKIVDEALKMDAAYYDARAFFLKALLCRASRDYPSAKVNFREAIEVDIASHNHMKGINATSKLWTLHYLERLHRAIYGEEVGVEFEMRLHTGMEDGFRLKSAQDIMAECFSWLDKEEGDIGALGIEPQPALPRRKASNRLDEDGGTPEYTTVSPQVRPRGGRSLDPH